MALFGQVAAPGATYSLQDALQMNNLVTVGSGLVFETNSYNVTIGNYQINNGATVNMGTGTWTLTGTLVSPSAVWNVTSTGAVVNSSSATIVITTTTSSSRTFNGADKTYGTLTYTLAGSTGNLIITGSNTFGTINFSDSSNARTLQFTSGTTTTITGAFNVNGTSGKLMTINSSTGGSAATLSKSSGTVSCDYLSIQDSTATGGAAWYAGANSTNVSGNTGWIFTAPANGAWFDIL
ncbi:hypothetical protein EPO04_00715 [Patescibacteria group bacterium]|nr:MAG: hypothetical protein EPO04_00715 [Patescibacteria group bacterium]